MSTDPDGDHPPPDAGDAGPRPSAVVCLGASAGGIEPLQRVLEDVPADTGMAFIVVQHLNAEQESRLAEILARGATMPVRTIADGMRLEPDHAYVIAPDQSVRVEGGHFDVEPRGKLVGGSHVIDRLFRSVADAYGDRAIGVILSGQLADGVAGLHDIKRAGGFAIAQDPASAEFPQMPSKAVAAEATHLVLAPHEIGPELARLSREPSFTRPGSQTIEEVLPWTDDELERICRQVKRATGVDFARYKRSTLRRRVHRRMLANRTATLADYSELLDDSPEEAEALRDELLIQVTRFFRDPEVFEALATDVVPRVLEDRDDDRPLRVWIAGCSTGEEAYSLAILLHEAQEEVGDRRPVQVFATDLSERAIRAARDGVYTASIADDVSPERLRRYFVREDGHFRVNKVIRSMCVFAVQSIGQDPPFSNMDLVSCRNVLIYLEPPLQARVLAALHYSLRPNGFLVLGSSESTDRRGSLFAEHDGEHRIYTKAPVPTPSLDHVGPAEGHGGRAQGERHDNGPFTETALRNAADRAALERFVPPSVVIDRTFDVVYFRGDTHRVLSHPPGSANLDLLRLVPEGLAPVLRASVAEAIAQDKEVVREKVRYTKGGRTHTMELQVIPLSRNGEQFLLIAFVDDRSRIVRDSKGPSLAARLLDRLASGFRRDGPTRRDLEAEVDALRQYVQTLTEEHEAVVEELRSANEEALSANEELHSTNEELETAKEELQSTNEELLTLNAELQQRNEEHERVTDDLRNVLHSVGQPIVMLGQDLRVRRFTPKAEEAFHLIPSDVGRPITDLKVPLDVPDLKTLVLEVLDSLQVKVVATQHEDGHAMTLRIHPYRTQDDRIEGVVLVLEPSSSDGA